MQKILIFVLIILTAYSVNAIQIHQVLYDPQNTDNGGEAIELYNPLDEEINLDGWTIATGTSDQDITFPKNATIQPHSYFLVADTGWSTKKDNSEWQNADYEETMTLANTDSGIALKNNGTIIDAVGWGDKNKIKTELYFGEPAQLILQGNSLIRIQNTQNNLEDFKEQIPSFSESQIITLEVGITTQENIITQFKINEDDLPENGIQIMPIAGKTRNLTINAQIEGDGIKYAEFRGKMFLMQKKSVNNYTSIINLPHTLQAGNYTVTIFSGEKSAITTFEYLSLKKLQIDTKIVRFNALIGQKNNAIDKIILQNMGNVQILLTMNTKELKSKNSTISADNLQVLIDDETSKINGKQIKLLPGDIKELLLSINVPNDAIKGNYTSFLKFSTD